jgi:hypothetical protein
VPPMGTSARNLVPPGVDRAEHSKSPHRIWRAAPLAVFVVSSPGIGALASGGAGGYPAPPFFHLFFSDTIHMKAWLATGASILALFQLLTAARIFELLHFPPSGRVWGGSPSRLRIPSNPADVTGRLSLHLPVGL